MIERELGLSGYRLKLMSKLNGDRSHTLIMWTPSYSTTLFLSKEEYKQLKEDMKEVFESGNSD